MELKAITFQSGSQDDIQLTSYYENYMEQACRPDQLSRRSPHVERQLVESIARERGVPVTDQLRDEIERNIVNTLTKTEQCCRLILNFIRLLEGYSGPPQWACTSRYGLTLYSRNYETYGDTPEDSSELLSVQAQQKQDYSWEIVLSKGSTKLRFDDTETAAQEASRILNRQR